MNTTTRQTWAASIKAVAHTGLEISQEVAAGAQNALDLFMAACATD